MNGYGQNNSHNTGLLSPFTEFVRSLKGIISQHLVSGLGAGERETLGITPSMPDYPRRLFVVGRGQTLATGWSAALKTSGPGYWA